MQKKLALIEPHHHSEVLRTFAQLFLQLGWQINIFTKEEVKEDCYELDNHHAVNWYMLREKKEASFIHPYRSILEDCELAIFVTILPTSPAIDLQTKTILVVHNGNTFFAPKANFTWGSVWKGGLKNVARGILFYLRNEAQQRQVLLASFDFLSLAAPSMSDYFIHQENLSSQFDFIPPLPFAVFEGIPKVEKEGIKIGITGTVREEGRDYKKVLSAFQKMVLDLQESVELIFLGGTQSDYAKDLIKAFKKIENDFFKIRYSTGFIAQKEFDEQLRKVDFLILPLKKSYRLGIIREVYGYTNISGGINDMIRFGIPTLISPHYPLEERLQKMTATYDSSDDLSQCLLEWIQQKRFLEIRAAAPQLLESYKMNHLAAQWKKQLVAILKKEEA